MAYVKDLARPESKIDRQITGQSDSWKRLVTVTPSDSTVYSPRLQAIYVAGTGNLVIENSNGDTVTVAVADGSWHYEEIRRVMATTSATGLVGAS